MKYLQPSFTVGGASDSYSEGHERTFGQRTATKGRWVYRHNAATGQVEAVEVSAEYVPEVRTQVVMDRHYENVCATDGTDIGSRRRHSEYMRRNNLAMADDFKGTWEKATRERESYYQGKHDREARRDTIARALFNSRGKKK